jgi:hypothetical protein
MIAAVGVLAGSAPATTTQHSVSLISSGSATPSWISPSGRYVAYYAHSPDELVILDRQTGTSSSIPVPSNNSDLFNNLAPDLTASGDERHAAFHWQDELLGGGDMVQLLDLQTSSSTGTPIGNFFDCLLGA